MSSSSPDAVTPTRRLNGKERAVFDRVIAEFNHLVPSDAEQLTQYAEAVVRYEAAAKETKKRPTVSLPVINRSTGNIVGEKSTRNPAWVTLKESLSAMNTLARRLMIDAQSAEKRQRLLSKRYRAEAVVQTDEAAFEAETECSPLMLQPPEDFPGLLVPPWDTDGLTPELEMRLNESARQYREDWLRRVERCRASSQARTTVKNK